MTNAEIVKTSQNELIAPESSMNAFMELAKKDNLDKDVLNALVAVRREEIKEFQRLKFFEAKAKFRRICPKIYKGEKAAFQNKSGAKSSYTYAKFGDVISAISPALSECGFDFSFDQREADKIITVTCRVFHVSGHEITSEFSSTIDNTGSKNDTQARGSTNSYLKRYTLLNALGLAVEDEDDDAHSANDNAGKVRIISAQKQKAVDEWLQTYGRDWTQLHKILPKIIGRNVAFLEELAEDECDKIICFIQDKINQLESKQ